VLEGTIDGMNKFVWPACFIVCCLTVHEECQATELSRQESRQHEQSSLNSSEFLCLRSEKLEGGTIQLSMHCDSRD
jgi:hypothetical protein